VIFPAREDAVKRFLSPLVLAAMLPLVAVSCEGKYDKPTPTQLQERKLKADKEKIRHEQQDKGKGRPK
jgi:hypothetical protein